MSKLGWGVTVGVIVLIAVVVLLLWPPSDPLANVQTVAIQPLSNNPPPADTSQQPPLVRGLEIALNDRHIRIVTDPDAADAVIAIEFDKADIHLDKNGIQATARAIITKKNGERGVLFLTLNVDQAGIHANFVEHKFWEFWK